MKKLLFLWGCTLFSFVTCFAQLTSHDEKVVERSIKYANQEEYDKAVDELKPVLVKYQNNTRLWNMIINFKHQEYSMKNEAGLGFSISVSGDSSGNSTSDSLVNQLASMLSGLSPKKMAFSEFVNLCREAERLCEYPDYACIFLRNYFVDKPGFENIPEKAIKFYNKAENAFQAKNYNDARKYYEKALDIHPKFYKAKLYLGDTYYLTEDYGHAARYFREAAKILPGQLEPHKYLVDALRHMHKYEEAMEEAISTILIYPDAGMFWKIEDLATLMDKEFNRNWIQRGAPVNVAVDSFNFQESIFEAKDAKGEELPEQIEEPWNYYKEAWAKIKDHTGEDGLLKEGNPVTNHRYAETFCWEYMLSRSDHESLDFAKKLQKENYLDCYALIALYNFDLYPQAKDLIDRNPDKVRAFLNSLVVSR